MNENQDHMNAVTTRPDTDLGAAAGQVDKTFANSLPMALRLLFDDDLYNRTKQVATYMSRAVGFTPRHLLGQPEACFAVATMALKAQIDPFFLAMNAYQTPGGQIGFMTKAYQAIADSHLKRPPQVEYRGDWRRVVGKFEIKTGNTGKPYASATWTRKDAEGLSAVVTFHFKDLEQPESFEMDLEQAFPLNSTLWATDPKMQFRYLIVRRGLNAIRPGIMGMAKHVEDITEEEAELEAREMVDVTPPRAAAPTSARGTGDVEPGTESSYDDAAQACEDALEEMVDEVVDDINEKPEQSKGGRLPPMKVTWRGKEISRTNFKRDVKQEAREAGKARDVSRLQAILDEARDVISRSKLPGEDDGELVAYILDQMPSENGAADDDDDAGMQRVETVRQDDGEEFDLV
jgi:RecT family